MKRGFEMKYKILFCDMDHTLLNDNLEISTGNQNAVKALLDSNKEFVVCTGRGIYGVEQYIQQLKLAGRPGGYVICQNGGTVYRLLDGKLILERSFTMDALRPAIEAAHHFGVDIQLYYDRLLMAEKMTPRIERYQNKMGTSITFVSDALEYKGKLTKCLLNGNRNKLLQLRNTLLESIEGKLNMFFSNEEFLEFTALEANKGNAMISLANELNINQQEIVAVGDSENDETMINMAGLGVAVFNAQLSIRQKADYVTEADNNHDAVKEVIEKFLLNGSRCFKAK